MLKKKMREEERGEKGEKKKNERDPRYQGDIYQTLPTSHPESIIIHRHQLLNQLIPTGPNHHSQNSETHTSKNTARKRIQTRIYRTDTDICSQEYGTRSTLKAKSRSQVI